MKKRREEQRLLEEERNGIKRVGGGWRVARRGCMGGPKAATPLLCPLRYLSPPYPPSTALLTPAGGPLSYLPALSWLTVFVFAVFVYQTPLLCT